MSTITRTPTTIDLTNNHANTGRKTTGVPRILALARITLGWVFLWAFLDKLFGLGMSTPATDAWIRGVSPTYGYLAFGTEGKALANVFQGLSNPVTDWLFMLGLLGLAIALILGIGMRVAAVTGTLLLATLYSSQLPLEHNPFVDEHVFYALTLIGLTVAGAGRTWGLGRRWEETALVQRIPALR